MRSVASNMITVHKHWILKLDFPRQQIIIEPYFNCIVEYYYRFMNSHRHFLATILHLYDDSLFYYLIKLNYQDNQKKNHGPSTRNRKSNPLICVHENTFPVGSLVIIFKYIYMYCRRRSSHQDGGDKIIRFNPHHIFCATWISLTTGSELVCSDWVVVPVH